MEVKTYCRNKKDDISHSILRKKETKIPYGEDFSPFISAKRTRINISNRSVFVNSADFKYTSVHIECVLNLHLKFPMRDQQNSAIESISVFHTLHLRSCKFEVCKCRC